MVKVRRLWTSHILGGQSASPRGGPEPEKYAVHWSRTGLENKRHKVVVSIAAAGRWTIVDGFIFTVNDDTNNTASMESSTLLPAGSSSLVDQASSTSVSASATTAARSSDNDASGGAKVLAIGLGVSFNPGSESSMIDRYILEKSVQRRVILEDVMALPPAYSV
ncbi:hypothetical protein IW262DRAFT_1301537 [Armillaria fumosa]|nr:hypothetical protein IW262DRAFT_1301537 [Armillaria fumosa]